MTSSTLKSLLRRGWIYETIATTFNKDKSSNSAPVGIYTKNFRTIVIELYKTSGTYRNIIRDKEFAVNFTDNISFFHKSAISKKGLEYAKSRKVNAPLLKDADGYLELKVIDIQDLGDRVRIESEIVDFKINKKINPVNRAKSLALEAVINTTKISHVPDSQKRFLKKEIREYRRVIKKVAPDSEYERIMEEI